MANFTHDKALRRLVKMLCILFEIFNKMNIINAAKDYDSQYS